MIPDGVHVRGDLGKRVNLQPHSELCRGFFREVKILPAVFSLQLIP